MSAAIVDLDHPVRNFGVNLSSPGVIGVRHLLTHTSEDVPGSSYRYNGGRLGDLDQVIQAASGRSFADLLLERILEPLELRNAAANLGQPWAFLVTGMDRSEFRSIR